MPIPGIRAQVIGLSCYAHFQIVTLVTLLQELFLGIYLIVYWLSVCKLYEETCMMHPSSCTLTLGHM